MKITIYELLGMVKDGKAPKKIKWNDLIYEKSKYNATPRGYYYRINGGIKLWLLDEINSLNDEVEIIEEEKKIPEKLDYYEENTFSVRQTGMTKEDRRLLDSNFKEIGNKINSIIDYLKSKGE